MLRLAPLLLSVACVATAPAADPWPAEAAGVRTPYVLASAQEPPGGAEPGHEVEGLHPHMLNLFLGYTDDRAGDGFTIGLDYEYRFSKPVGVGGYVDYVAGDIDVVVLGVAAYGHPWKELVLVVAPGVEVGHGQSDALVRLGGFYEIPVGDYFVSPAFYVDLVEGKSPALIGGVNLGKKF
ncbi:MAG: hypothetical protein ACYTEZ_13170 [Planctomycetota bacterium]|jgi:hypothetical protein